MAQTLRSAALVLLVILAPAAAAAQLPGALDPLGLTRLRSFEAFRSSSTCWQSAT